MKRQTIPTLLAVLISSNCSPANESTLPPKQSCSEILFADIQLGHDVLIDIENEHVVLGDVQSPLQSCGSVNELCVLHPFWVADRHSLDSIHKAMVADGRLPVVELSSSEEFEHYEVTVFDEGIGAGWLTVFDEADAPIAVLAIERKDHRLLSSVIYVRRAACGKRSS